MGGVLWRWCIWFQTGLLWGTLRTLVFYLKARQVLDRVPPPLGEPQRAGHSPGPGLWWSQWAEDRNPDKQVLPSGPSVLRSDVKARQPLWNWGLSGSWKWVRVWGEWVFRGRVLLRPCFLPEPDWPTFLLGCLMTDSRFVSARVRQDWFLTLVSANTD